MREKRKNAVLAALFAAVALTAAEREYLASVVCVTCGDKPLCERVAFAAEITERAAHTDAAEAVRAVLGEDARLSSVAAVDRAGEEYRLSCDAVDAACAGAKGK